MFLISCSSIKTLFWFVLKLKTPIVPAGNISIYFFNTVYPRRRRDVLVTASLATLFGAMNDILFSFPAVLLNLNIKLG